MLGSHVVATLCSTSNNNVIDAEVAGEKASAPQPVSSESVVGAREKRGFQAETLKVRQRHGWAAPRRVTYEWRAQLLDIVTHSLYSEKEVFVRELISNASDALEKIRQLQSIGKEVVDADQALEVRIWADETKRELIIEDFGSGM